MKKYAVEYTKQAVKSLEKMDGNIRRRIIEWIDDNLDGCEDPRLHGKALQGVLRGKWRYRVGDYRIVADILDDKILIMILDVDHRSQVYK